jgi:hypothetical protein
MDLSTGAPQLHPARLSQTKRRPQYASAVTFSIFRLRLGLLQLWFPFVENGTFNRTNGQASTAIDASSVIDVCVLGVFGIGLAVSPVDTLDRTDRNTIPYSFANISDYGVGHLANSSQLLIASNS